MRVEFKGKFKSLTPFVWDGIPSFVILTGPNGSGKSQLLELLYGALTQGRTGQKLNPAFGECTVEGLNVGAGDAHILRSEWKLLDTGPTGFAHIDTTNQDILSQFRKYVHLKKFGAQGESKFQAAFDMVLEQHGEAKASKLTIAALLHELPDSVRYDNTLFFNAHLSSVYLTYRYRSIDMKDKGSTQAEIETRLGKPPWQVVDALLRESRLPFEINNPSQLGLLETFTLTVTHKIHGTDVQFSELSSGEQVLLSIVFLLFSAQHVGLRPGLLLLDEPDAHLHPAMTKQLLDVLHNVLVKEHNVRIIATTHSPTTVALCPEGSLFEMALRGAGPQLCASRDRAIEQLTEGIVTVLPGTRYVLVEGNIDADFYKTAYRFLINTGRLRAGRPLVFVSTADEKTSSGGGKRQVEKWSTKLHELKLDHLFRGLRDSDNEQDTSSSHLKLLHRDSLENYLLDPILVYAVLLLEGAEFPIDSLDLKDRRYQSLVWLESGDLQKVADSVHASVEPHLASLAEEEKQKTQVTLFLEREHAKVSEVTLTYPSWLMNRRGKDLLKAYYKAFCGKHVNVSKLLKMFKSLRTVPADLEAVFQELKE